MIPDTRLTARVAERVQDSSLHAKVMNAEQAAALIKVGGNVGMSGFTGAGHPKAVPQALAARLTALHAAGQGDARISVWTGASTAPELDGALAQAQGIDLRLPYQSDPTCRERINAGQMHYTDLHLSHVAPLARSGALGPLDVAVIEVVGILPGGRLIPSTSVGNNQTWLDLAGQVILEVNLQQNTALQGMHDIEPPWLVPPHSQPLVLRHPSARIGQPFLRCDPAKVVAVVMTDHPDRHTAFTAPDEVSAQIAGHLVDFLKREVACGRMPLNLLPLQSGVGNIANAVMAGLNQGPFEHMTAYTEVLQDGLLAMLRSGKLAFASATALSLSPQAAAEFNAHIDFYRERIVLRTQEMSNQPELIRRLGVIAMNAMIEADIYGNVNSTHIMGSSIMNGIGGSGDFARHGHLSIFMTPSLAKGGKISCIVPMVSHHDHTEHDVQVIVTEHGLADLRGLAPAQRAERIVQQCAHPRFRPALRDYMARARRSGAGLHTPHLLDEALSWHSRYLKTGQM
jgi:succinyl-CoA:acetate CoA-transferase